jgi:hypothetical protein
MVSSSFDARASNCGAAQSSCGVRGGKNGQLMDKSGIEVSTTRSRVIVVVIILNTVDNNGTDR